MLSAAFVCCSLLIDLFFGFIFENACKISKYSTKSEGFIEFVITSSQVVPEIK